MKVTLNNTDAVNATITIELLKDDYAPEVKKALANLRKTANIPGFRKGMVPATMIQKMYGKPVLVDEVNKLVSQKLYDYIRENDLKVLGEPLPSEKEQAALDFDNQTDYEFVFDIALSPEMDVKLSKSDKMPYYTIAVTDEMVNKQIESYKANYGQYNQVEEVEGKDMAKGLLVELNEDGSEKAGGINLPDAVLMPSFMKDEAEKAKFMGAKLNSVIVFSPYAAYEGNSVELSSFLKIEKDQVDNYKGNFSFKIEEITRYAEAEMNQELFDKVFGKDEVKTEEEFVAKVKEILAAQFTPESDYKFILDAKELLLKKAEGVQFPDELLKRWLIASNPEKDANQILEEYPLIIKDLTFQLIRDRLVKDNNIQVNPDEVKEYSIKATRAQFVQYGMTNIPDSLLEQYASEMFKKEESVRNLIDKVLEDKLIALFKETATLKNKDVTIEEFQKLVMPEENLVEEAVEKEAEAMTEEVEKPKKTTAKKTTTRKKAEKKDKE